MDARIVDGRKIAKVTSEGRLLVEPTVLRGTYDGEPVAVQVTADGELVISAAVHVGDVTATIGEIEAKGSPDDGVTWVPVRVDADGRLEVQLSGNYTQLPDVIAADTVITAGSNLIITNGGQPFVLGVGKQGVAVGYSLESRAKAKLAIMFYSAVYPTSRPLSTTYLYDSGASASVEGAGVIPIAYSSRYALRLFNADAVDMTVKVLTRAEVS
jgi:hypothetical protein